MFHHTKYLSLKPFNLTKRIKKDIVKVINIAISAHRYMYQCLHSSGKIFYRCSILLMLCWFIGLWGEEANGQTNPCPDTQILFAEPGQCEVVANSINLQRGYTAISYEFAGNTETPLMNLGTANGQSFNVGITMVTYTYENRWGWQGTCSFVVAVVPNIIMPPDNQERNIDTEDCSYTIQGDEFDPVYDCGNLPVEFSVINDLNGETTLDGKQLPLGETTITWSFQYYGITFDTRSFTVTVYPNIEMPEDDQKRNSDPGKCSYTVSEGELDPGYDCDSMPLDFTMINDFNSKNTLDGKDLPLGETTIIWTFSFKEKIYNTKSFTITVYPKIEMPEDDQERNTDSDKCFYTINGNEFDPGYDCDAVPAKFSMINNFNFTNSLDGELLPIDETTIIWTFLFNGIEYQTKKITVNVKDKTPPIANCQDITVTLLKNTGTATITGSQIDNGSMDNCALADNPFTLDIDEFNCLNIGKNTVTLTVWDFSGNHASCTSTVTVQYDPLLAPKAEFAEKEVCNDSHVTLNLTNHQDFEAVTGWKWTVDVSLGTTSDIGLDGATVTNGDHTVEQAFFNSTNTFTYVEYHVVPMMYMQKCELNTITLSVIVNPHPKLIAVKDTSICNHTSFVIDAQSNTIISNSASIYFDWAYKLDDSDGDNGRNELNTPIEKEDFQNATVKFQNLTYTLTPLLYLNEQYCISPFDINTTITVEPTPLIKVSVQDTVLCNGNEVFFEIDSMNYPFGNWQYWLKTENPSDDFATPEVDQKTGGQNDTFSQTFQNKLKNYQTKKYNFSPRIITKQNNICEAAENDTVIVIHVNPTPLMNFTFSKDSICHKDNGPQIFVVSDNGEVQGDLKYNMWKIDYINNPNDDVVANVAEPGSWRFTDQPVLDQTALWNKSEEVQTVNYFFYPFIEYHDLICLGESLDPKQINIAPELKYDTIFHPYHGGYHISCNGLANGSIFIENVSGGWSNNGYSYQWKGNTNQWNSFSDSIIGLKAGVYEVSINDNVLKCETKKIVTLLEPEKLIINNDSINNPNCHGPTGYISVETVGGTEPYLYTWFAEDRFEYKNVDFTIMEGLYSGNYIITVLDNNECKAVSEVFFNYFDENKISISMFPDVYGSESYNISCPGANDGTIIANPGKIASFYKWVLNDETIVKKDSVQKGGTWFEFNTPKDFKISGLGPGEYGLTIIDTIGCEFTANRKITLTEPNPISFDSLIHKYPNDYQIKCSGDANGRIEISDVKGAYGGIYTYDWTVLEGDQEILNPEASIQELLTAGIYQLTISNSFSGSSGGVFVNGICTNTSIYKLTQPPELNVTADILDYNGFDFKCFGDNSGSISLSISGGGNGDYSYSWSTEEGSGLLPRMRDQNGLSAGVYTVEVGYSDGLCTQTEQYPLFRSPEPLRNDYIISDIKCYGENDASIQIDISGGIPNYAYLWRSLSGFTITDPAAKDQLSLAPGNYELLVTDLNGCEKTEIYELTNPAPILPNLVFEDVSCTLESNVYGNDGYIKAVPTGGTLSEELDEYRFLWRKKDDPLWEHIGSKSSEIDNLSVGSYMVTITDANGCEMTESANISEPYDLVVTAQSNTPYNGYHIDCYDSNTGKISLIIENGRPGYTYQWSSGEDTETIEHAKAGEYLVTVTDRFNCKGSATINLTQPTKMWGQFVVNDVTCYGENTGSLAVLVGGGRITHETPYRYQWSNGDTDVSRLDQMKAGSYSVRVIDNNGCHLDTVMTIKEPPEYSIKFMTSNAFCLETNDGEIMATISGATPPYQKFEWKNLNGDIPSSATQGAVSNKASIKGLPSSVYTLEVTDAENCKFSREVLLDYISGDCVKIPNAFSPNEDGFNDRWEIFLGDPESFVRYPIGVMYPEVIIEVWSTNWGLLLYRSQKGYPEPWDGKYNGKYLPVNSYQYIIRLNNTIKPITGNVTIIR